MKMKTTHKVFRIMTLAGFVVVFLALQVGCSATGNKPGASVFSYDQSALQGAKPWTSKDFKNDPNEFQFAVIGDRTGGSDPGGIYNRAVHQLNLLQPEFVISVGDLIEGYTKDKAKAAAEWEEFEGIIKPLNMPFFYVVGNHDMGNDALKQVWLERRGADYYYFIYRGVLFLVFNSEDPSNPVPENLAQLTAEYKRLLVENPAKAQELIAEFMAGVDAYRVPIVMSDRQLSYFRKVLADHPNVRWTFAFFHQPDWNNEPNGPALQAIEQMLKDRPYTVITGHEHYYDIKQRNGRDYITMGPVGASWHKNGNGNVDHILWVTMKDGGPEIAMITLDGIWDRQGRNLEKKEVYERTAETEGLYSEP
jgi:predicted phosphodiesterase